MKGTRGAEGDEPVLVEGELVGLAPELVEVVGVPVGIFADHLGKAFFAAAVGDGAAIAVSGGSTAGAGYGGDHGDAVVEGSGDEGGFAGAGDSGDYEFGFVDGGVGLEVVDDAGDSPGPGVEEAPVILWIGREEASGAVGPASVS